MHRDGETAGSAMRLTLHPGLDLSPRTREAAPGRVARDKTPSRLSGARAARLPEAGGASGGHAPGAPKRGGVRPRRVSGALPRVPRPVVSPAPAAMLDCAAAAAAAAAARGVDELRV